VLTRCFTSSANYSRAASESKASIFIPPNHGSSQRFTVDTPISGAMNPVRALHEEWEYQCEERRVEERKIDALAGAIVKSFELTVRVFAASDLVFSFCLQGQEC
jgi:hypothetical protein